MNIYRHGFLSIILLGSVTSLCINKIVYLISPPRSLSVAFLRMMDARGDFSVMHEPSQFAFNLIYSADIEAEQSWFLPDASRSFDEVKKSILLAAQNSNVFVKEMSFAVRDFLLNDDELMQNSQVYFVFLVRNPHHTLISLYKRLINIFDEISYQLPDVLGYKALYDIFCKVHCCAVNKPYIMLTEDLYNDSSKVVEKFCLYVGIEFKPESLHWKNLGESFDGHTEWHEIKHKEATHHWHGDAIKSTCFGRPTMYEIDKEGNPTFAEITNSKHRVLCQQVFQEDLPYYKLLLETII